MSNHDTALVLALWAVAAIVLGLVLLDGERTTVDALADPELTDTEVDAEFAALTAELEPDPAPYDHEKDGL